MYVSDSNVHIGGETVFDKNSAEVSLGGEDSHILEIICRVDCVMRELCRIAFTRR